eukprot:1148161-Pelagomonas_calceolata.AAC.8
MDPLSTLAFSCEGLKLGQHFFCASKGSNCSLTNASRKCRCARPFPKAQGYKWQARSSCYSNLQVSKELSPHDRLHQHVQCLVVLIGAVQAD